MFSTLASFFNFLFWVFLIGLCFPLIPFSFSLGRKFSEKMADFLKSFFFDESSKSKFKSDINAGRISYKNADFEKVSFNGMIFTDNIRVREELVVNGKLTMINSEINRLNIWGSSDISSSSIIKCTSFGAFRAQATNFRILNCSEEIFLEKSVVDNLIIQAESVLGLLQKLSNEAMVKISIKDSSIKMLEVDASLSDKNIVINLENSSISTSITAPSSSKVRIYCKGDCLLPVTHDNISIHRE